MDIDVPRSFFSTKEMKEQAAKAASDRGKHQRESLFFRAEGIRVGTGGIAAWLLCTF